jgi:arginine deiminase
MMAADKINIHVNSEIGELEAVIIHSMGSEVENMTPQNAERALYSDILSLSVAQKEYSQFREVLHKAARVLEISDLLSDILEMEHVRKAFIDKVSMETKDPLMGDYLMSLDHDELARQMIEGVELKRDSLSGFLSHERYALRPLHNFFFTRDASVSVNNEVYVSNMASKVRERESLIMGTVFDHHPLFNTRTQRLEENIFKYHKMTIEGGDVLIGREDLLLIGIGSRTTPAGVDAVIEKLKKRKTKQHVIVHELPTEGESFIHLDMVFTFLNTNECMIYEPVILQPNRYKTIHIEIENDRVKINEEKNVMDALSKLGIEMEPVFCGGETDQWTQEREQWHSGANFFAIAPGKIIGYNRNLYTLEELSRHGYEIIEADEIISGRRSLPDIGKCVVTIEGSELSRGGGGARCMTMPVRRKEIY